MGADAESSGLTLRLANVYALEGRTEEADAWFEKRLRTQNASATCRPWLWRYNLRGVTCAVASRLDEAERCHRDALALDVDAPRLRV